VWKLFLILSRKKENSSEEVDVDFVATRCDNNVSYDATLLCLYQ